MVVLENYKRRKDYLICIDSDGCVMDTMDIKHKKCFAPEVVREWNLYEFEAVVMNIWNRISLYSMTRGINRFKALYMVLEEVNGFHPIEDLSSLKQWIESNDTLSNATLEAASSGSVCLTHALSWSCHVNEAIGQLPDDDKRPFQGAKSAVEISHQNADIAVVSSANIQAVEAEWRTHGIINDVDVLCAQDTGSKEYVIRSLLGYGYDPERVIMIGDAPGDLKAAEANGVLFYPILVENEKQSWEEFKETTLLMFMSESYAGEQQTEKISEFVYNLNQLSKIYGN